jgi:mannose-1-phosphate guanylyltransferase
MRALLLAGGFGTRLRPLTNTIPKCLVPICGTPLLALWLESLTRAGVGPCLVNTHYLADQVRVFADTSPIATDLQLVHEDVLLGTAGTLLANIDFFQDSDGLLAHADNFCLADMADFKRAHLNRPAGCVMTAIAFRTSEPSACGIFELDEKNVVVGFHEKVTSPPGNLANGAVYILSAEMIKELRTNFRSATDFSTEVMPRFLGRIYSYETSATFLDIGTPENYSRANHASATLATAREVQACQERREHHV